MAEIVLDIVAEGPEKGHVAEEMQPAAMQEHRGEHGRKMADRVSEELARYERPMAHKGFALALLDEKHQNIGDDE